MLNPGDQAPSLELNQVGAGQIQIQPDGRPVILLFFAPECPTCRFAVPPLNRLAAQIAPKGGRVFGISQDNKKKTLAFLEANPCDFPVTTDRGLKASLDYDPERVPAVFLLDGYFKVVRRQASFHKAALNSIAREMCDLLGATYESIGLEHDGAPDFKEGTPARQRDIETIVEEEARYLGVKSPEVSEATITDEVRGGESAQPEPSSVSEPPSGEESSRLAEDASTVSRPPIAESGGVEAPASGVEVAVAALELRDESVVPDEAVREEAIREIESQPLDASLVAESTQSAEVNGSGPLEVHVAVESVIETVANKSAAGVHEEAGAELPEPDAAEDEEIEIGDGLPMVEPTVEQLAAFVSASHRAPEEALGVFCGGVVPVTVEFAAQFAARAGCVPEDMRIFCALVAAAADPLFDLKTVRGSNLALEPLVIVNGSIRTKLQMPCRRGALSGASARAVNLGRAFSLLVRTIGAVSRIRETRTLGHPGRLTCVLAENEEASPWESLSVELGASGDAVTIIAAEAPVTYWEAVPGDGMAVLSSLSQLLGALWNPRLCGIGDALVALCPAHARAIALGGMSKAAARRHLFDHAVVSARDAEDAAEAGAPDPETESIILRGRQAWRKFRSLESVRIIVTGDESSETSVIFPALLSPKSGGAVICANVA